MQRAGLNSPEIAPPVGPFSHLVTANGAVYLSGRIALGPASGTLLDGDVAAQTEHVLANLRAMLKAMLKAAGKDLSHVVNTTVFLTDMADYAAMNAVYVRHFTAPYPARTAVAVAALPLGACVEIECIAHLKPATIAPDQTGDA